jgi:predicted nucleotidyltransferase
MTKADALHLAKSLKERLLKNGYPVHAVYLYGSMAKGTQHPSSDIDVAVVCDPFLPTRHEENMVFRRVRRDIDRRIEPVTLHPEDFANKYSTIAREVKRFGIVV